MWALIIIVAVFAERVYRVDVIKVRMQADRTGTLYRGMGDAVTKIYQREGMRGFLRVSLQLATTLNIRPMWFID